MEIVLNKAFSMVAIIFLGYFLKRVGFLKKEYFHVFSRLTLNVTLPCVIIGKFNEFTMDYAFLIFVLMGLGLNLLTVSFGYLIGSGGGRKSRAFYMINLSGFNIGAFTLPFVQNFLGANGVVATCLFDAGNSLMCTGGTYALASTVAANGEKQGAKAFLKKLFTSIPMDTYLIMLFLSMMNWKVPSVVLSFTSTVGAANSFLAMLVIGIGFEWKLKKEQLKAAGTCLAFRYGMSAILAAIFYFLLPFSDEIRQAMTLIAFAPLSALCPVFTQKCGGDESLSSTINSLSIICSTVMITSLLLAFQL
ncbi:MAG: AEC family transporter [Clostridiales bacterium]|nr:AEC family transporter [Clostridiales bacterium]